MKLVRAKKPFAAAGVILIMVLAGACGGKESALDPTASEKASATAPGGAALAAPSNPEAPAAAEPSTPNESLASADPGAPALDAAPGKPDAGASAPERLATASSAGRTPPPPVAANRNGVPPGPLNFEDDSLSFRVAFPEGAADDQALSYLRKDAESYLRRIRPNARTEFDRAKRAREKPEKWEVRIEWRKLAQSGDLASYFGEASEYSGGASSRLMFDTHIADVRTGETFKPDDLMVTRRSPSPALQIAICEALKAQKRSRIQSETIFDEPIQCAGTQSNLALEKARMALAPSSEPGKFGGFYVYYEPYAVGAAAEGAYRLVVQQDIFAEDLRPEFKNLFGGSAPPPAP